MNADLTGLGRENESLHADDIADIQLFERVIGFFSQVISGGVDLDLAVSVLDIAEGCLAHLAFEHHTSGYGYISALQFREMRFDLSGMMGLVVFDDLERVSAGCLQLRELVPSDLLKL